ncbi:MAG: F0F1 ATP synthase subunit I [Endozoicomonas sp.]
MTSRSQRLDERERPWLQRPPVHRVIVAQLIVTTVLSAALFPLGYTVALSAWLGGLCCLVPNAYFIWRAFRFSGAGAAKLITRSFYQGEAGKLVLTAVMFILTYTLVKSLEPVALLGAFILVQMVNWFTPLLVVRRRRSGQQ